MIGLAIVFPSTIYPNILEHTHCEIELFKMEENSRGRAGECEERTCEVGIIIPPSPTLQWRRAMPPPHHAAEARGVVTLRRGSLRQRRRAKR